MHFTSMLYAQKNKKGNEKGMKIARNNWNSIKKVIINLFSIHNTIYEE